MGYTLKIGEAVISYSPYDVCIDCSLVSHDDAPAFGEPTDHENQRWPSYSVWADAMKALGLMNVMFNERSGGQGWFERNGIERQPLILEHPGAAPITIEHVEEVEERIAIYKAQYPTHTAQYPLPKEGAKPLVEGTSLYADSDYSDDPTYDASLCRGEWLAYWLRWAVENCKQPVFVNH
jgi:hypothetical protein